MEEAIDDPVLGRLVYDDAGEWYEGAAEITEQVGPTNRPATLLRNIMGRGGPWSFGEGG